MIFSSASQQAEGPRSENFEMVHWQLYSTLQPCHGPSVLINIRLMGLSMPSPPSAILLPSIRVSGIYPAIYYVTSQHLNCSRVKFPQFQLWQENKAENAKLETELATLKQDLEKTQRRLVTYNQKVVFMFIFSFISLDPAIIFIYLSWNLYH